NAVFSAAKCVFSCFFLFLRAKTPLESWGYTPLFCLFPGYLCLFPGYLCLFPGVFHSLPLRSKTAEFTYSALQDLRQKYPEHGRVDEKTGGEIPGRAL
ncbi:hypothetical protein, partial [Aureimonas sp. N4]